MGRGAESWKTMIAKMKANRDMKFHESMNVDR